MKKLYRNTYEEKLKFIMDGIDNGSYFIITDGEILSNGRSIKLIYYCNMKNSSQYFVQYLPTYTWNAGSPYMSGLTTVYESVIITYTMQHQCVHIYLHRRDIDRYIIALEDKIGQMIRE